MENAQKTSEEITSSDWKLLRLNFSGPDRPGIISELTQILASYDVLVLDVGQAVIHRHFTLGFLIHCSEEKSSSLIKDLLFRAYNLGLQVTFTPIEVQEYNEWRAEEVFLGFVDQTDFG
jgi:phosphoserine phosphatase